MEKEINIHKQWKRGIAEYICDVSERLCKDWKPVWGLELAKENQQWVSQMDKSSHEKRIKMKNVTFIHLKIYSVSVLPFLK